MLIVSLNQWSNKHWNSKYKDKSNALDHDYLPKYLEKISVNIAVLTAEIQFDDQNKDAAVQNE